MVRRYGRRLAVVGVLALALALSGCGNSKKGNGYGLAHSMHPVARVAAIAVGASAQDICSLDLQ